MCSLEKTFNGLIIGGHKVATQDYRTVINPATEEEFCRFPVAERKHLDVAVNSAKTAFPGWRSLSADEREYYLMQFADQLEAHNSELADLLSREQGKPVHSAARDEVEYAVNWLRKIACQRLSGRVLEDTGDQYVESGYVPLGVAGLIVPWNFPVVLAIWKLAPALITGNCVILKPSPYTPLSALMMGELALKTFPPGVVNVLTGDDELGAWMTEHPGISKISFTGSVPTGKKVMASAAKYLKHITLELGGNDPAIVLHDADINNIVPSLFWGAFGNSGQWCVGIKRLYVHEYIYDELLAQLVQFAKNVVMGNGADPKTQLGPVQNLRQYKRLQNLLSEIKTQGYNVVLGGESIVKQKGYFIPVTLVDNPPENSRIVKEEQFGPILPVLKYTSYDEVVAHSNNTIYGLGASVWGSDLVLAEEVSEKMNAGTVWINEVYVHHPNVPFGGFNLSGIGEEHGREGLAAYTKLRIRMRHRNSGKE